MLREGSLGGQGVDVVLVLDLLDQVEFGQLQLEGVYFVENTGLVVGL